MDKIARGVDTGHAKQPENQQHEGYFEEHLASRTQLRAQEADAQLQHHRGGEIPNQLVEGMMGESGTSILLVSRRPRGMAARPSCYLQRKPLHPFDVLLERVYIAGIQLASTVANARRSRGPVRPAVDAGSSDAHGLHEISLRSCADSALLFG